ncbi:DUF1178 family protein [Bordetella genomosp. 13]|uniref:DUF1178 family protein n=1 Tax=Bordetella genomosp. 13 TaxID=463040 RepID=UPI0011A4538A|nr:DUF1178 family protein [Bordetella genomosp. 13]
MALKVFDLQCDHGHVFEGWFGSHDDYDTQRSRGLVACPMCDSKEIVKRLSAPHLNVAHLHQPPAAAPSPSPQGRSQGGGAPMSALQAQIMRQVRELIRNTENVGPRFAEEARRIHEGEADERPIRGVATPEERAALAEDGIDVMAVPAFLDDERLQ